MKDNTKKHPVWTTESSFLSLVEKDVKNTFTQTPTQKQNLPFVTLSKH